MERQERLHLIGSIPLDSSERVFRRLSETLGPFLRCIPDGETGERMTDAQLRDETMTIFLAGHETTANTLAWTLYLLSEHPDVARRLQAELDGVSARLAAANPRTNTDVRAWAMPLRTHLAGGLDRTVLLLGVGATLILVLAVTTVANLLFSLLAARLREFAVRTALGADRSRLVRQVLTESAPIAFVAAAGGIAIAWTMVTMIRAASPPTWSDAS